MAAEVDPGTDDIHSLVALKILLGLSLLSYSALRQAGMGEREAEDSVNDFGRAAVGERPEEAVSDRKRDDKRSHRLMSPEGLQPPDQAVPLERGGRLARLHLASCHAATDSSKSR